MRKIAADRLYHLTGIVAENERAWPHNYHTLWTEFYRIQAAAGVKPEGHKPHYTFHDLRRAYASMNAGTMSATDLQTMMRHKSFTTTQRYVSMGRNLDHVVAGLHRTRTAAEINVHLGGPPVEFITMCMDRGVKLALGGDAHHLLDVGNFAPHLALLEAAGAPRDLSEVLLRLE